MSPSTTLSATWQLRQVRDRLTAQLAELHLVLGFVESTPARDTIRTAAADVASGAGRVERALEILCNTES